MKRKNNNENVIVMLYSMYAITIFVKHAQEFERI